MLYLCFSRYPSAARSLIAHRLIELGANVNARGKELGYVSFNATLFDQEEWYPIEAAAGQSGDSELIRILLEAGADPRRAPIVLSQAVRGGNREVLRHVLRAPHHEWQIIWALKACAVLDKKDMAEELAPYIAPPTATNKPAVLEAIRLERGAELIDILLGKEGTDALRSVWRDALRAATRFGHHAAIGLLRQRGADASAVTDLDRLIGACIDGNPPPEKASPPLTEEDHRMLAWAVRTRRHQAVPLLIEAGFDPNVPDTDGETPLHLAARSNAIEATDVLLHAGAPVGARNFDGETPLDVAVAHHHEEIIKRLLATGTPPKLQETDLEREEMNLLFERAADAVVFGDLDTLRELLDDEPALIHARSPRPHRATLFNYCGSNGVEEPRQRTPENAPEIMRLLLDRGADVNATCNLYGGGATTLYLLITSGYPTHAGLRKPLVEMLISAGAIVGGKRGAEGIVGAAALGRVDLVRHFYDSDKSQVQPAFYWACEYGRTAVVEFLLDRGVDIEAQGENGMTGLHLAALNGHLETVKLLLARRAPLELKTIWGGTVLSSVLWGAINWDPSADYVPIIDELIKHGAVVRSDFLKWWLEQKPLTPSSKERIAELLSRGSAQDKM